MRKPIFRCTKEYLEDIKKFYGVTIDKDHCVIDEEPMPPDSVRVVMKLSIFQEQND